MGLGKKIKEILDTVVKVVALIAGCVATILLLVALAPLIVAAVQAVTGWLVTAVTAIGKYLWGAVKPFFDKFKPILSKVADAYDRWIKPTLEKLEGQIHKVVETFNKIYGTTVGSIVDVYQKLFGWVDDLRATVNGILDKTTGLAAVFDQKLADKIQALKQDFNETLDKLFVDWFDKVLEKINEIAAPILNKIGEIEAVFTEKIDAVKNFFQSTKRFSERMQTGPLVQEDEDEIQIMDATKESEEETERTIEIYARIEEEKPPRKTRWQIWLERFTSWLLYNTADIMDTVRETIDNTVKEIAAELYSFDMRIPPELQALPEGEYGEDILKWAYGEMSLRQLIGKHWRQIFFDSNAPSNCQEALEQLVERLEMLKLSGVSEEKRWRIYHREVKRINRRFPGCIKEEE